MQFFYIKNSLHIYIITYISQLQYIWWKKNCGPGSNVWDFGCRILVWYSPLWAIENRLDWSGEGRKFSAFTLQAENNDNIPIDQHFLFFQFIHGNETFQWITELCFLRSTQKQNRGIYFNFPPPSPLGREVARMKNVWK